MFRNAIANCERKIDYDVKRVMVRNMWHFISPLKTYHRGVSSTFLALLLVGTMSSSLLAGSKKAPPPDDLPPTTGGQSAGSRGCGIGAVSPLQLIIPPLSQTQTRLTKPTLLWYQEESSDIPVELRIFEYHSGNDSATIQAELFNPKTRKVNGFTVFEWPSTVPALSPGKQYIWQVELVCNPNRPSGNIFADAPIKILPAATDLNEKGYEALNQLLRPQTSDGLKVYQQWLNSFKSSI